MKIECDNIEEFLKLMEASETVHDKSYGSELHENSLLNDLAHIYIFRNYGVDLLEEIEEKFLSIKGFRLVEAMKIYNDKTNK